MLKATSILSAISELDRNSILLSCSQGDLTYADILQYQHHHQSLVSKLTGKSIGLFFSSDVIAAIWLMILDGACTRITLLPKDTEAGDLHKTLDNTEAEYVISDIKDVDVERHIYIEPTVPVSYDETTSATAFHPPMKDMETEWILLTSGTTGQPKLVKHTFSSLTHTVKKMEHAPKYRWGLLYGINRFAGLQVFLQSILSGAPLVIADDIIELSDKLTLFSKKQVNALSATPTYWRKILMTPQHQLLALDTITLGGEIADQQILNMLSSSYCNAKIRHIYASTEAGVGFSVTDGKTGFPYEYLNTNTEPFMKLSHHSTLMIKSPMQSTGYIKGDAFIDKDGYIDTGDIVEVKNARCVFLGRKNGVINVGGNKVSPEVVEAVLLAHPDVAMASVSAKKNPITGNIVQAIVVPKAGSDIDKESLKASIRLFCKDKLLDYMIPAITKVKHEIKTNPTGKVIRE